MGEHKHNLTAIKAKNGEIEPKKKSSANVEKWSTEHPRKTKQDIFLEQWPETKIGSDGILSLCPAIVSSTHRNQYGGCKTLCAPCDDCCREFWTQEME